ncbi:MAG: hypothetical protein ABW022_11480 [Actinoplanes sp.]
MTAPTEAKERTAAVWFAGLMTLAMGGAGLLVAALAVGLQRAATGELAEGQRSRERRASWLGQQKAWLAADRDRRMAHAEQRRQWLAAGGDPTLEPTRPSRGQRFGAGLRRLVARTAVGASDFAKGAGEGWRAANQTRKAGGDFRQIAASRPGGQTEVCSNCRRDGVPVADAGLCADCVTHEQAADAPAPQQCSNCRQIRQVGPDGACADCHSDTPAQVGQPLMNGEHVAQTSNGARIARNVCGSCGKPAPDRQRLCAFCESHEPIEPDSLLIELPRREPAPQPLFHNPLTDPAPAYPSEYVRSETLPCLRCEKPVRVPAQRSEFKDRSPVYCGECAVQRNTTPEGDPMPDDSTQRQIRTAPGITGESNATVLRSKLSATQSTLHQVADLTDQLAALRTTLDGQVRDADEFAQVTGQSAQARTALDEASALSSSMGEQLGDFSQGAVSAEEQMRQASDGLRVAENAEDELRAAGADGRAVAPAGANA